MQFVESFDLFGTQVRQIPNATGEGAPTVETVGAVGDMYMDTYTGNMYKCVAVESGRAVWVEMASDKYRHIATITQDKDGVVKSLDVTKDSKGNPFSCSDFLIFATFPPIETGVKQFYIGPPKWKWIAYEQTAFSDVATLKWRMHLRHCVDGKWCFDGVYSTPDKSHYTASTLRSNICSTEAPGEKLSELNFYANNPNGFPKGTVIEIYGK